MILWAGLQFPVWGGGASGKFFGGFCDKQTINFHLKSKYSCVQKRYSFENLQETENEIHVSITHSGSFTETLPILKETTDTLQTEDNGVLFIRDNMTLQIQTKNKITLSQTDYTSGNRQVIALNIDATDSLNYSFTF